MATLTNEIKIFIIQSLACYDFPSTVSKAVLDEFDVKVDRSQIGKYDPTKVAGRNLAKKYKELFEITRSSFIANQILIPIANKNYRLRQLQKMFDNAMAKNNIMLAKDILAQASRENTVEVFKGGMSASYVKSTGLEGLTDDEIDRRLELNQRALDLAKATIATAAAPEREK